MFIYYFSSYSLIILPYQNLCSQLRFDNASLGGQDSFWSQGLDSEVEWSNMFSTSIKLASSWRTPLEVAPEGVLT